MTEKFLKITVSFERRDDGGLRAWSEDVPGLALSHTDIDGVLEDVTSAIEVILSHRLGVDIEVTALGDIRAALEHKGVVERPKSRAIPSSKEYVAHCH